MILHVQQPQCLITPFLSFSFLGSCFSKNGQKTFKIVYLLKGKKNWTLPLKFISLLLLGAKMPWLLKQKKEVHIFHKAEFVIYDELPPSTEVVLRQWTITRCERVDLYKL